jgi:hypothetical protein
MTSTSPCPLVGGQRLAGGCPAYELQRSLQFASVFLEPLAIKGIATREVFFEGLGGPNTELGAAFRLDPITDRDNDIQVKEPDGFV